MNSKFRALSSVLRPRSSKIFNMSYSSESFVPPKRIPRSSTDILRAIADTVGKDPTAPHYKFHDDPYLIPYSNPSKRSYSLAQEAGRKAAQWIRQQHSELFNHKEADPFIETFAPKPVYNEESNVNEEILKNVIHSSYVTDALTIYELLINKGQEISQPTKLSLLELLCYYNGQDPLNEDWIEERWYRQSKKGAEIKKNTWKGKSPISEIFQELSESEYKSEAYCALITGMLNYGQIEEGWNLYEKSNEEGIILNTNTYNAILAKAGYIRDSHSVAMELVQSIVTEMNEKGIQPNLGTLNAFLQVHNSAGYNKSSRSFILKTFSEFKRLNIEPSPASYYYLIVFFYRNREELRGIMLDMLDRLEGTKLKATSLDDTFLFLKSMEVASVILKDKEIAYKIDDLLHFADNYNLIGDSFKESHYYRSFFTLISGTESFEVFMDLYNKIVPNVYIPEPLVMMEILNALSIQLAYEHLPRFWSDLVMFDQVDRIALPEKILSIAQECMDDNLKEEMIKVVWSVWEKLETLPVIKNRQPFEWTGNMLGNIIIVLSRGGDLSKAHLVMNKLIRNQTSILGEPQIEAVQLYIENCITNDSPDSAIKCIKYCHEMGFIETEAFARKVSTSFNLNTSQRETLVSIVGENCIAVK